MKTIGNFIKQGLVIGLTLISTIFVARAQENVPQQLREYSTAGVGPVVAGSVDTSQLPGSARKFIEKHVKGTITEVDREYLKNEYDVKMSTGVEIEFDKKGKIIEVDAADNAVLDKEIIKQVVTRNLYQELADRGMLENIEAIKVNDDTFNVEFRKGIYDEAVFSEKGDLIVLYED